VAAYWSAPFAGADLDGQNHKTIIQEAIRSRRSSPYDIVRIGLASPVRRQRLSFIPPAARDIIVKQLNKLPEFTNSESRDFPV
jgi:hypothetical protein